MGTGNNFTIVDTPGFGHQDAENAEIIDNMVNILGKEIKVTNVFLLLLKLNEEKEEQQIPSGLQRMLREVQIMFGSKFWSHVILGFSIRRFEERLRK